MRKIVVYSFLVMVLASMLILSGCVKYFTCSLCGKKGFGICHEYKYEMLGVTLELCSDCNSEIENSRYGE